MEQTMEHPSQPKQKFGVGEVIKSAWHNTKGAKGAIWLTGIAAIVTFFIVYFILSLIFGHKWLISLNPGIRLMSAILNAIISAPFLGGIFMVAIQRARGEKVNIGAGFQYFKHFVPLAIATICLNVILSLGGIIGGVIGKGVIIDLCITLYSIILAIFLMLLVPLVADKQMNPFKAIGESFRRMSHVWFRAFFSIIICDIIIFLFAIPLFLGAVLQIKALLIIGMIIFIIALIWLIPFIFVVQGTIYQRVVD